MKSNTWFVRLSTAFALLVLGTGSAWAATATWSEEMDAFPNTGPAGQVWGGWDDAGGGNGQVWSHANSQLEQVASFDGAAGVWKIPGGAYNWHDMGMAVANENAVPDDPSDNTPNSPITTGTFTFEARYRINTTMGEPLDAPGTMEPILWPSPESPTGKMSVFPLQFMGSAVSTVAPGWRIAIGYINQDANDNEIEAYYQTHMNEGIGSWGGQNVRISPSIAGPPPMDVWQTVRMTSTYDKANGGTGEFKVYLNGNPTPIHTFDLTGKQPPPVDFTRSVGVQRQAGGSSGQGNPDPKWIANDYVGMEVMMDYIRVVNGTAVPITESVNAPGGGCAGNLNGDGTTDGADVAIIYNAWGTNNATADVDNSGTVDGADLAAVFNCWGQADTAPVPEPASLGVLGWGLVGLMTLRRRLA